MTTREGSTCRRIGALAASMGMLVCSLAACSNNSSESNDAQEFSGASAEITRGDLVGETTVQGTLHYADSYTQKSSFDGVITALPTPRSNRGRRSTRWAVKAAIFSTVPPPHGAASKRG